MNTDSPYTSAKSIDLVPKGDAAREAIDSLRGYAYQVFASALAWVDIKDAEQLYLEVAEDYALVAQQIIDAVQVKDTAGSGAITLNNDKVHEAIAAFVDLVTKNPLKEVRLRYLTTSSIGTERAVEDRPGGIAGLEYWRKAAAGADVAPLRAILDSNAFPEPVRLYVRARNDAELRAQLLQRIRWDCGQPDFATLRQDLEERLVVVGRDRFQLPAPEARRMADFLAFRVLKKSVLKDPKQRVLTKSELYQLLGEAAEVSVPRSTLTALLGQVAALTGALPADGGETTVLAPREPGWLIESQTIGPSSRFISRPALQDAVALPLSASGKAILTGASGLGKSHIARVAAEARADAFVMIDLRDANAAETRHRLDIAFGRIGGLDAPLVIFEDLNHIDDPQVSRSLGRVMHALRERDRAALLTCYRVPSAQTVTSAGFDQASLVACPYFTEEETCELVRLYGGDAELWGRLAHFAGAGGHPQLTHAFVVGLSARGWPPSEMRDFVDRGLTSQDIDAAREDARRSLIGALPENARALLYRASLLIGRFSRLATLALAEIPPPIGQAGEAMDLLVGPWIEVLGPDQYRVSPLASGTGRSMLSEDEQRRIHAAIAVRMLSSRSINASDIDAILTYALLGKESSVLFKLATIIIHLSYEERSLLAENLTLLPLLQTETAIYAEEPSISAVLRLAQFKVLDAGPDKNKAAAAALAAMTVVAEIKDPQSRELSETLVLSTVLSTLSVADYFDEWLDWLLRWKQSTGSAGAASELRAIFEEAGKASGHKADAIFFAMGTARITTAARLEKIIDGLATLDPEDRATLLTPIDAASSDYSVLINGPWSNQQKNPNFDAADAAECYARIAQKTKEWSIPLLAAQSWIARAVLLDEFMGDSDAALALLNEAATILGESTLLTRAKAKIHFRRNDHAMALHILRGIADVVGHDNRIERAFALREGAISAGRCDDWRQAEIWFREAAAALGAPETDDLRNMAIGLGADAAVAALNGGQMAASLNGFAGALTALKEVDPDSSLGSAYLHRVIRHAVLWAKSVIDGAEIEIGGEPIAVPLGSCSNPDPMEAVRQLPLGAIDASWYMLADCEIALGFDGGIAESLPDRLSDGPIAILEMGLRTTRMQRSIERTDAVAFAARLTDYISAGVYMNGQLSELKESFNPVAPPRGQIPRADLTTSLAEQLAIDAILAFSMRALYAGRLNAPAELQTQLRQSLGEQHPGHRLFENVAPDAASELGFIIKSMLKSYADGTIHHPRDFWTIGFRFFEQHSRSAFGSLLFPHCATWLRENWINVLREQRFLLSQPLRNVPPIMEALDAKNDDRALVASLLLAATAATSIQLPNEYVSMLREAAAGGRTSG